MEEFGDEFINIKNKNEPNNIFQDQSEVNQSRLIDDKNKYSNCNSFHIASNNNVEEDMTREDKIIKGFLFKLMNPEGHDEFVNINFNTSVYKNKSSSKEIENNNLIYGNSSPNFRKNSFSEKDIKKFDNEDISEIINDNKYLEEVKQIKYSLKNMKYSSNGELNLKIENSNKNLNSFSNSENFNIEESEEPLDSEKEKLSKLNMLTNNYIHKFKKIRKYDSALPWTPKYESLLFENDNNDVDPQRDIKYFKRVYDSLSDNEDVETNHSEKYDMNSCIIHPESNLKAIWEWVILISVIYCIFVYPVNISFPSTIINVGDFYFVIDLLIDIVFVLDFIFCFFTPFNNKNDNLTFDKLLIFKNYMSKYITFLSDICTTLPLVVFQVYNLKLMLNICIFFRFLRFLVIFKVNKHSNANIIYETHSSLHGNSYTARAFRYAITFVVIVHLCTCIWIWIGLLEYTEINRLLSFLGINEYKQTWINRYNYRDKFNNFEIYISSLYFTLTTIYTIGYGDILSYNVIERFYNNIIMIVGVMLYSFVVSNLSFIFAEKDKENIHIEKKLEVLGKMKAELKLSDNLYEKIKKNLLYNSQKNNHGLYDEKYKFLKSLPITLKNEITVFIYAKNLKYIHFFNKNYIKKNYDFILTTLPYLLSTIMYKNEIIFNVGEIVEECYIVNTGYLSITINESHFSLKIAQVPKNYNFGEILMYLNELSPFNLIVSSRVTELMVIKKEKFTKLKVKYPDAILNILKNGCKLYSDIIERRNFILKNINKLDISKYDQLEMKKLIKKLKMDFLIQNDKLQISTDQNDEVSRDFQHNVSDIDIHPHKSYKLNDHMNNLSLNLNRELNLFNDIKKNSLTVKTLFQNNESKNDLNDNINYNNDHYDDEIFVNTNHSIEKNSIEKNSFLFKSRNNTIGNYKSMKDNKFKRNKVSKVNINFNYFDIKNNINEHYLMMDQNFLINQGNQSKNKLMKVITNNKLSLKKKNSQKAESFNNEVFSNLNKKITESCCESIEKINKSNKIPQNINSTSTELFLIDKQINTIDDILEKILTIYK